MISSDKLKEIVSLCNEKIKDQKDHEASGGYGEDYNDGRIVGGAALARRILGVLKDVSWDDNKYGS